MMIVNATGHVVRKRNVDGSLTTYPPTDLMIRLESADVTRRDIVGEDVVQRRYYHGSLPAERPDVLYIVSRKVAYAYSHLRGDLIYPDTEDGAEREAGRVYAVRRFRRPDRLIV